MSKQFKPLLASILLMILCLSYSQATDTNNTIVSDYESVDGDPMGARIYTLDNGLKVYLSANKDEPRVQTYIAVRAGSKNDPADNTGLAHYLEHMLFKGTSKYGTVNWEEEQKILKQISDLYEKHKATDDDAAKREIYKEIDALSLKASELAVSNEYDKMISSLGTKGTNAYTSTEQTVYVNDIPASELEKWLKVESERFSELVLRLFHTELEAVYEEFNIGQDSDNRQMFEALMEALYTKHQYGTQSVIGTGPHLKNPSMEAIHNYFNTYYIPNNMAICLAGDLDYDKTIGLIKKYFGDYKPGKVPEFTFEPEAPITSPVVKDVYGPQQEFLYIGYRLDGAGSKDALILTMINKIMQNGQAGLMDLNLIQKQKVLDAGAFDYIRKDYSTHIFYANARDGQKLEECKDLILEEIEKIKKGEFEEWLLEAVIKNMKLDKMKAYESNRSRANEFVSAFILDRDWKDVVNEIDELGKITKADIVNFANEKYGDNYAVCYKRLGESKEVYKVEKPAITPINLNRANQSEFFQEFQKMESAQLDPVFLNYKEDIQEFAFDKDVKIKYIENKINKTFNLYYTFDMGTKNNPKLGMAISYLPYLATDKYTAEELKQEFFKLGVKFDVSSSSDQVYVSLSGLEESLAQGVELFEHILSNAKPNDEALKNMVADVFKERENNKLDKTSIFWRALFSYGLYGPDSEYRDILSADELNAIKGQELVDIIKDLRNYPHTILYYGQKDVKSVAATLARYHQVPEKLKAIPPAKDYAYAKQDADKVYFVNYDMVQAQVLLLSLDGQFDQSIMPVSRLFSEYFGSGLSSIIFQEIRESKALAYSAFASYSTPREADKNHFSYAFIGTQADKLNAAVPAMRELLNKIPLEEKQFNASKNAVKKKIETERITKTRIFFDEMSAKKRGLDSDIRKKIYNDIQGMTMADLEKFFNSHIANKKYSIMIMGNKEILDMDYIKSLGEFQELTLEEIFNY